MNEERGVEMKENGFANSLDNKRYYTYNCYLKRKFGEKVYKVPLNGGFTCPNIDGTKGIGGCTYCSAKGSGDFAGNPEDSIIIQFDKIRTMMSNKWQGKCIAYFQANTNTYAPLPRLKELYKSALECRDVVGLDIATRADCISEETADYLAELSERTYLTVELGLQSIFDETGRHINRCMTYSEFLDGYNRLKSRGINVCVHLIDGLPGETREMMLKSAETVGRLSPHSIKIHLLHVIKGTRLAEEYAAGLFQTLEFDEYVEIICSQLELIPPDVVIQRLTGDGVPDTLIAPLWSKNKRRILNAVDKKMAAENIFQGDKL